MFPFGYGFGLPPSQPPGYGQPGSFPQAGLQYPGMFLPPGLAGQPLIDPLALQANPLLYQQYFALQAAGAAAAAAAAAENYNALQRYAQLSGLGGINSHAEALARAKAKSQAEAALKAKDGMEIETETQMQTKTETETETETQAKGKEEEEALPLRKSSSPGPEEIRKPSIAPAVKTGSGIVTLESEAESMTSEVERGGKDSDDAKLLTSLKSTLPAQVATVPVGSAVKGQSKELVEKDKGSTSESEGSALGVGSLITNPTSPTSTTSKGTAINVSNKVLLNDEDMKDKSSVGESESDRTGLWSEEENELLRAAVDRHGARNWSFIATFVPGRNATQCVQHWHRLNKVSLQRNAWTFDEDKKLTRLVAEHGGKWTNISKFFSDRTAKQCRERWTLTLDPNIVKEPWSEEEDKLILNCQMLHGNKWTVIRSKLPGRTVNAIKTRFRTLSRGVERDLKIQWSEASEVKLKKLAEKCEFNIPEITRRLPRDLKGMSVHELRKRVKSFKRAYEEK